MEREFRQLSFWHDTVTGSLDPRPSLQAELSADVAIVGAGYAGLWTAYYLKRLDPGLNIVILEAQISGFGASGRNGGWCSGYLSGIDAWLDRPEQREAAIRLQRLMFDSVHEVGAVCRQESIDCHFDASGALEIAVVPRQVKRLRDELRHVRELGFGEQDYQWLEQSTARDTLNVDNALAAIHMKHCAAVHPSRLVRGLAETVERLGVSIFEQTPVTSVGDGRVEAAGGSVRADRILVTTEGYSATIEGRDRILVPMHSMMVVTEPLDPQQVDAIRFHRRYCFGNLDRMVTYGQLTADRRIAFGCRGGYHFGSGIRLFDPADPEFEQVRQTLIRFFPDLAGIGFTHAWGGAMGVSRTLRPAVHYDRNRGLGWAGGFFGNGVGAANLAGRTLADLVLNRDTERIETPWVKRRLKTRKWEPEPLRWLGVRTRAAAMQLGDWMDYRLNS